MGTLARRRPGALGVGLVIVALAACSRSVPHRLTVAVDVAAPSSICDDPAGIDLEGTSVVVTSGGEELASAALGPGGPPTEWTPPTKVRLCRFKASVEVPERGTYVVTVDEGPALRFASSELERTGWVAPYPSTELPALAPDG